MRTTLLQNEGFSSLAVAGRTIGGVVHSGVFAAFAFAAVLVTTALPGDDTRRIVPVAIPAATASKPRWDDERIAFASKLVRGYGLKTRVANEFSGWILEAAARQRLAPELLASLIMTESSFRKHVRSPIGAIGPAQVRAQMWDTFCGGNLHDPEQNVYCGAQILAHYQHVCARRAKSPEAAEACALRSYNLGYGNRDNIYFAEAAIRYVAKIDRYRSPLSEA